MENWGLIIGNRSSLLFDPERPSDSSKRKVVTTQCHEIAHMWCVLILDTLLVVESTESSSNRFGNITTMKWWDNLYLNEGMRVVLFDKTLTHCTIRFCNHCRCFFVQSTRFLRLTL